MIRKLLLSCAVMLVSVFAVAQSGTLKGKLTDKTTKEPIPFANIIVELAGKQINGGTTDINGDYTIKPIQPGSYDVKCSYIGYKKQMYQGVSINTDKITFLDIEIESTTTTLDVFEVKTYKVALIDKDQTSTGSTITSDQIAKMPGRSAESIAATTGGVFSNDNGDMGGIRGSRAGGTATYVDGVRIIGSSSLPKAALEQVSVITGGTPAMYGDLTGGVINITTKGPARIFGFGMEGATSELLDGYGVSLLALNAQGPLIMGKDSTKSTSLLGFFISGDMNYARDGQPAATGTYQVNDSKLDYLRLNPYRPSGTGFGTFANSEFVTKDDLVKNRARVNAGSMSARFNGKVDVRTTDNTTLTFGGSYSWARGSLWNIANSMFNYNNYGESTSSSWRVYGKFTQRFPTAKESTSLVKNVYYSIQADYSNNSSKTYNPLHKDNLFEYGYVGKFKTYSEKSYEMGTDPTTGLTGYLQTGYRDTLYSFQRSEINSDLSNYTEQYYNIYDDNSHYRNKLMVESEGALLNGNLPKPVYGLYANTGTPYNGYGYSDNSRFGFGANGSADIGKHELQFGLQYEQRKYSGFSYNNPAGIWTVMRGLTNKHILQLDLASATPVVDQNGVYQDTINYDRLYDPTIQSFFDKQLRSKLGLAQNGTDWIDIDNYDPSTFKLNMFSQDELLNNGNPLVSYNGYDPYGNKLKTKPAFEDFFNQVDDYGNHTRAVGSYEPIYMAGYVQDRFAFNDLIFTLGLRFDRFDANQKVLKDPYLFSEAKTVAEVTDSKLLRDNNYAIPSNMGKDYVVYVNDVTNPTAITGYRNGSTWYNARGTEISDPTAIQSGSSIAPYLVDPSNKDLTPNVFKDYDPQNTVSPRISFSFPISDEALFFAHYDILTSRPTSGNMLPLLDYYFINQVGMKVINNPNLKPERTTDYELGFQQKITNSSSLKFSAYYRENRDQVQAYRFSGAYPVSYISYANIDFGTTKGVTLTFDLRKTKNLSFTASYTLQFANATGSSATSGVSLATSGQPNLRTLSPIDQDRNHSINIIADYRYSSGAKYNGPTITKRVKGTDKVKVIKLLENTGVNIMFGGGSGLPYSAQSNITSALLSMGTPVLKGSINGSRLPWQFRMDLKIDRDFYIKRKEGSKKSPHYLNVYLRVQNVLNTKNIMSVYRYTGNPDDDGYLSAAEYQAAINANNSPTSFRDLYSTDINNPYNYTTPRRITLGAVFNF